MNSANIFPTILIGSLTALPLLGLWVSIGLAARTNTPLRKASHARPMTRGEARTYRATHAAGRNVYSMLCRSCGQTAARPADEAFLFRLEFGYQVVLSCSECGAATATRSLRTDEAELARGLGAVDLMPELAEIEASVTP